MRKSHGSWPSDPANLQNALIALVKQYMARLSDQDKRLLRLASDQESLALYDYDERFNFWPAKHRAVFARRLADEAAESRAPLPLLVQVEFYRLTENELRKLMMPVHIRFNADQSERRKLTPEIEPPDMEISLKGLIARWQGDKKRPRSTEMN